MPGEAVQSDEELRKYVRNNAWGHHASCSLRYWPEEQNGVLDSSFRVHGTRGLRVVDASVFPRIPGFFIVSAVYMIGEKAADVILGCQVICVALASTGNSSACRMNVILH